jgi:hypothetical protein
MKRTWKPAQEGDRVAGIVKDVTTVEGRYGRFQMITVEGDAGVFEIPATSTVLRQELDGVQVGESIDVIFEGKRQSGAGREYRAYSVSRT